MEQWYSIFFESPKERARLRLNALAIISLLAVLIVSYLSGSPGQIVRASGNDSIFPREKQDAQALELGKSIERELAGGQSHVYQIALAEGQYLQVSVEQRGIDVMVRLLGPGGKQVNESDYEIRSWGQEVVSQVAETAGSYRLNVQAKWKEASAGRYELRVVELRAATEKDRALQEAIKLNAEHRRLYRGGQYKEALPLAERELAIREKEEGPGHRNVASVLGNLALIHHAKGDHAQAEQLFQRALAAFEQALGPEHPDVASTLSNLAVLYRDKGEFDKMEPLFQRALAIREWALGLEHPLVAESINNFASLAYEKGDYARAESLHQRALEIRKKALGPEHPAVGASFGNLAILYGERGDLEKAGEMFQQALAIFEKALGPEHPQVEQTLNNLGTLYNDQGSYAKAEPLFLRALAIREKALGPEHPRVAIVLMNLAMLYHGQGDHAKSESLHGRALAIREKALGPEHPDVAFSLRNFASLVHDQGDYGRAEPMLRRALAIWEKVFGPEHPNVVDVLDALAVLYAAKGEVAQAVKFQTRASGAGEHNIALNLAIGSERQKLVYLTTLATQASRAISLHLHVLPGDPAARSLAVATILQRKGRALDAMSDSLTALRQRFDAKDQALLDQLKVVTAQLAESVLNGPGRIPPAEHQKRIRDLEDQKEKLEDRISRRSGEFRAQSQPITLEAVQAAIPADTALVEFVAFQPFNPKVAKDAYGAPHYAAYILRRQGEIQWKELGEAKAIDDVVAALRQALRDPKRQDVKEPARVVDEKVMRPVRSLLGGTTHLLISPDGALNLIPFAALVDEQGRYLVERHSINYLTSGRDLLRLQVARASKSDPLVVAAPAFGEPEIAQAAKVGVSKPKASARARTRQSVTATTDLSSLYFTPLGGAAEEARAIKSLFPNVEILAGARATEASLKRTSAPQILHVSTHGFFLEDQSDKVESTKGEGGAKIVNPLLRSGLALAGANLRKSEGDDGILTAMEAAGLNLWGTKLVVLSACDTGVGEVKTGEGVHGLRRALVLAGAETQVMSLWRVDDYETRKLMTAYYRRLKQGLGRGEALRQAQLKMLRNEGIQHPFYWAGFIQSGEWARLDGER
jgi:CHAT domain-containing protein/Tfp pilus assembly protein PilF